MKTLAALCLLLALTSCFTPQEQADRLAEASRPQLGVDFEPEWYSEGKCLIKNVPAGSPAAKAGLKPLDQIIQVGNTPVNGLKTMKAAEMSLSHGQTVPVTVVSPDSRQRTVPVTFQ